MTMEWMEWMDEHHPSNVLPVAPPQRPRWIARYLHGVADGLDWFAPVANGNVPWPGRNRSPKP